jgi:hypothetical protein
MNRGYVYVLTNPSMPGLVKIGKTTRTVGGRAGEIYQTGVPTPFEVFGYALSPDCDHLERECHRGMSAVRINPEREFFKASPTAALRYVVEIRNLQIRDIVEEYCPELTISGIPSVLTIEEIAPCADDAGVCPGEAIDAMRSINPDRMREVVADYEKSKIIPDAVESEVSNLIDLSERVIK